MCIGGRSLTDPDPNNMSTSIIRQKKIRIRSAVIDDIGDICDKKPESKQNATLEGNKDHLETKKQIELLCKTYGDGWLQNHATDVIKTTVDVPIINIGGIDDLSPVEEELLVSSTPINDRPHWDSMASPIRDNDEQQQSDDKSVYKSFSDNETNAGAADQTATTVYNSVAGDEHDDGYGDDEDSNFSQEETATTTQNVEEEVVESDAESNENLYIVTIESTGEELFLNVSDTSIREKDYFNGR